MIVDLLCLFKITNFNIVLHFINRHELTDTQTNHRHSIKAEP